jgi:hypothetical protein
VTRSVRVWAPTVVMVLMAIGIVVEGVLLIPVIQRQATQSEDGRKARVTQCAREPVLRKLVFAGKRFRLLTPADVDAFTRTAPRDCPVRRRSRKKRRAPEGGPGLVPCFALFEDARGTLPSVRTTRTSPAHRDRSPSRRFARQRGNRTCWANLYG